MDAADRADFAVEGRRVFVAGHRGMVGAALVRALGRRGAEVVSAPRPGVDLRRQAETEAWLRRARPDAVIVAAALVGGIRANAARPAEFLHDNLVIAATLVEAARRAGVAKLVFLGSSCIYPRAAPQPIPTSALLSGPLEPTNEWYAIAKIAGVKLCQAYRSQYGCNFVSVMPCNLYGPGDRFDPDASHVVPGLMRRMHAAKRASAPAVTVWGSGAPRREFLHVDDLAVATLAVLERHVGDEPVNVGSGEEVTVAELARLLQAVTGFAGRLVFDPSQPDGAPRKVLDSSAARRLGWRPRIALRAGLEDAYAWFLGHVASAGDDGGAAEKG